MTPAGRVLCSIGTGPHEELLDLAGPTFEGYARRHGYSLDLRSDVRGLGERPVAWAKIALIRDLLEEHELVVWIDADAMIVDPTEDIAGAGMRPIDLVCHEIGGVSVPNTGVMVVRRCRATNRLLERIWSRTHHLHHRWWENAAMIEVLGGDPDVGLRTRRERSRARRLVGALDPRWNSIPICPATDPAIVHLAGVSHDERRTTMQRLAERAMRQV